MCPGGVFFQMDAMAAMVLFVVVLGSGKWCPTRSNATTG
jgi:hypothetical protein